MPPPSAPAELPLTVVFVSVSVPRLSSPPPLIPEELAVTTTLASVSVPRLRMPPPDSPGALPPRTVRPAMVTLMPAPEGSMSRTRSTPPASMMVVAFPVPLRVRSPVTSRSPEIARSSPAAPLST